MASSSKQVLGLMCAAAAGALVGLLLAPEKGSDLRKKVSETANDWAGHLTDLFSSVKGEHNDQENPGKGRKEPFDNSFNNISESYT